jgi:hypothetical protein
MTPRLASADRQMAGSAWDMSAGVVDLWPGRAEAFATSGPDRRAS